MKELIKLTPVNANLSIEIKLEKCGDVYYRKVGMEEWKNTGYAIVKDTYKYYVTRTRNRLNRLAKGTKKECLETITDVIRTIFVLCQGKD